MHLHTNISGYGQPIIILHGFLGMGDNWKSISKQFIHQGFEVHLPDMRNHGKSPHEDEFTYQVMAEDINIYFKNYNITNAILIGHSMGGKIAMHFAAQYPENIQSLIIVDISPRYYKPHHDLILESLQILKNQKLTSRSQADEIIREKIKDKNLRLFLLKNLKREIDNTLTLKPNVDVFVKNKDNIGQSLPSAYLYNGKTLFIKGQNSNYITEKDFPIIDKHFLYNTIKTIPNAGHWVHAENPKEFIINCLKFIKK